MPDGHLSTPISAPSLLAERFGAHNPNLAIWNRNEPTDAVVSLGSTRETTKTFKRSGGFEGRAINPTYVIKRLTAEFGPIGEGWGYDADEQMLDGAPLIINGAVVGHEKVHVLRLRFWYIRPGATEPRSFISYGQTTFVGSNKYGAFTDEEAPKKSLTDAISKAASWLGFSADVHLGLWDDTKYVNDRKSQAEAEQAGYEHARNAPFYYVPAAGNPSRIRTAGKLVAHWSRLIASTAGKGDADELQAAQARNKTALADAAALDADAVKMIEDAIADALAKAAEKAAAEAAAKAAAAPPADAAPAATGERQAEPPAPEPALDSGTAAEPPPAAEPEPESEPPPIEEPPPPPSSPFIYLSLDGIEHVSATAKEWQDAWLKRIRQLASSGRIEDLREAWAQNHDHVAAARDIAPKAVPMVEVAVKDALSASKPETTRDGTPIALSPWRIASTQASAEPALFASYAQWAAGWKERLTAVERATRWGAAEKKAKLDALMKANQQAFADLAREDEQDAVGEITGLIVALDGRLAALLAEASA